MSTIRRHFSAPLQSKHFHKSTETMEHLVIMYDVNVSNILDSTLLPNINTLGSSKTSISYNKKKNRKYIQQLPVWRRLIPFYENLVRSRYSFSRVYSKGIYVLQSTQYTTASMFSASIFIHKPKIHRKPIWYFRGKIEEKTETKRFSFYSADCSVV